MTFLSLVAGRSIGVLCEPGLPTLTLVISLPSPTSNRGKRLSRQGSNYENTTSSFKNLMLSLRQVSKLDPYGLPDCRISSSSAGACHRPWDGVGRGYAPAEIVPLAFPC